MCMVGSNTANTNVASSVLCLQARARGFLARRRYCQMRYNHYAVIIQKAIRGWLAQIHYQQEYHHVVVAQGAVRHFLARRMFKKLKQEARSMEHIKKLNKGLENKIISLQQKRIGNLKARVEQEKKFLTSEHDQDCHANQKLLTEYNLLEQRSEGLERELTRLHTGVPSRKVGHQRSLSNASTISTQDDVMSATSELPEDASTFLYCWDYYRHFDIVKLSSARSYSNWV